MKNKIVYGLSIALPAMFALMFIRCKQDALVGPKAKETGKVYFPDADSVKNGIVAALNNYAIDTAGNTISFPVRIYRGGFSDFTSFVVNVEADNSSITSLVQSDMLPANTVALDAADYELEATDTVTYVNGIMKGAVMPKIKVANLSKYGGKNAALGITMKSAGKFDVNTSMNKVVIYFPVDSLVGQVYFPDATGGAGSVFALSDDSYSIDSIANTVNYSIPVIRGGIADLAATAATVTVDNSAIAGLISSGKLSSNTVALASSDYTFNSSVVMSNNNDTLRGNAMPKISIAKLSQYAGKVVALGLTISDSKFTIDPDRNKIVVYFNADDILALFAPRVNLISDIAQWTQVKISNNNNVTEAINTQAGTILFKGGNGGYDQAGVYQEVHLYGHRQYQANMHVKGSGATNVWFEVWLSKKKPQDGQDVTTSWDPSAVQLLGLNTWNGCGVGPFDGQLAAIGCSGNGGVITVPAGGTYYLTIKTGGNNLGTTGITASDFDFE